ncbi:MAG: hypothetical protein J5831_02375 [Bacteroidales bacterium]|nr:hypothetical protein [Bacteroidales bacterium]
MKNRLCTILCLLTLLGVVLMDFQELWRPFKMKPLDGFTATTEKPRLTWAQWHSGAYQDQLEQYIRENFGFREFLIRVYNQFTYSGFHQINNDNIIEGADHELFLKMYLDDITGKRLFWFYHSVEEAKADAQKNMEATLTLIDQLHRHGTDFLFVFAPSKTAVYPEYMPKQYQDAVADFSLQDYYLQLFKENNIPHIDFLSYFQSIKNDFPYPLYTRTGTHWAESTIPMVADSLFRKLETITPYRLPSIDLLDEHPTTDYSGTDRELEASMNLLFPLRKPALPRPVFTLKDTLGADRPNLLVIGDSYFGQLQHSCFVDAFDQWDYWQYNRDIYSSRKAYEGKEVNEFREAYKVLKDADIVIAMFTAPCFYKFMYGFPETAKNLYEKGYADKETAIRQTIRKIKENPQWYEAIVKQADEHGLDIEENLRNNAVYVLDQEFKKQQEPKE